MRALIILGIALASAPAMAQLPLIPYVPPQPYSPLPMIQGWVNLGNTATQTRLMQQQIENMRTENEIARMQLADQQRERQQREFIASLTGNQRDCFARCRLSNPVSNVVDCFRRYCPR